MHHLSHLSSFYFSFNQAGSTFSNWCLKDDKYGHGDATPDSHMNNGVTTSMATETPLLIVT